MAHTLFQATQVLLWWATPTHIVLIHHGFAHWPLESLCIARHAGDMQQWEHMHVAAIVSIKQEVLMPWGRSCHPNNSSRAEEAAWPYGHCRAGGALCGDKRDAG